MTKVPTDSIQNLPNLMTKVSILVDSLQNLVRQKCHNLVESINKILQKQDDASAHVKYCFAGEKRKFRAKKEWEKMVRIVQSNFDVKKQENMGLKSKVVTWV